MDKFLEIESLVWPASSGKNCLNIRNRHSVSLVIGSHRVLICSSDWQMSTLDSDHDSEKYNILGICLCYKQNCLAWPIYAFILCSSNSVIIGKLWNHGQLQHWTRQHRPNSRHLTATKQKPSLSSILLKINNTTGSNWIPKRFWQNDNNERPQRWGDIIHGPWVQKCHASNNYSGLISSQEPQERKDNNCISFSITQFL